MVSRNVVLHAILKQPLYDTRFQPSSLSLHFCGNTWQVPKYQQSSLRRALLCSLCVRTCLYHFQKIQFETIENIRYMIRWLWFKNLKCLDHEELSFSWPFLGSTLFINVSVFFFIFRALLKSNSVSVSAGLKNGRGGCFHPIRKSAFAVLSVSFQWVVADLGSSVYSATSTHRDLKCHTSSEKTSFKPGVGAPNISIRWLCSMVDFVLSPLSFSLFILLYFIHPQPRRFYRYTLSYEDKVGLILRCAVRLYEATTSRQLEKLILYEKKNNEMP